MPGQSINDLPVELLLDNIFPLLSPAGILGLGATNKNFQVLANDEAYWHRRIQEDFNFSGSETARKAGWKFLYSRLSNPQVYVWGEKSHSRLGVPNVPKTFVRDGVPFPIKVPIPNVRIVSLVAGGMSFHALDSNGNIWVWGILDGTSMALRSEGYAEPSKRADHPMRLKLDVKFRSISCGRLHTMAMDASSQVWTFLSWGRPFRLGSALVDRSSPETTPIQVEAGWMFCAILTESGDVLVYWPFSGRMKETIDANNEELNSLPDFAAQAAAQARATDAEPNVVPCHWWTAQVDPVRLPPIPARSLPVLAQGGNRDTKLVRIAGLDNNIIGLTNNGHVLRYGHLLGEDAFQEGRWEYLPHFSDLQRLKEHSVYKPGEDSAPPELVPPPEMHITHISAAYETFVAYSTGAHSVVLMGKINPAQDPVADSFAPKIIPALQNQSVISVVLGDYHFGALTETGKLLTWGAFSKGALGLGDPGDIEIGAPGGYFHIMQRGRSIHEEWGIMQPPPDVTIPAEVSFYQGRKRETYCFAAAAAGWHTGALVVDLEPDDPQDNDTNAAMPGTFPPTPPEVENPQVGPALGVPPLPFLRGHAMRGGFRIGFAGRGLQRGGGGGSA